MLADSRGLATQNRAICLPSLCLMPTNQSHTTVENITGDSAESPDLISYEIKRAREGAKLSILELSARTGISKTVLHGYERGRTKPGARELKLLCEALKVSPNRLLFGVDDFDAPRTGLARLVRLSRTAPSVTHIFVTMILPVFLSACDEAESVSFMVLMGSILHGKDPERARMLFNMVEILATHLEDFYSKNEPGTPIPADVMAKIQAEVAAKSTS